MRHRLRNVWGMQTFAFAIMDAKERGATWAGNAQLPASGIRTLAEVFDCSAGTGYLNGDMFDSTTADDRAKILGWARSNDYTTALQQWRSGGHLTARNGTLDAVVAAIPSFVAWNDARGLESITYEDGSHMIVPPEFTDAEKAEVIPFYGRLHEQPGAGDIYRDAKAGIAAAGVTLQINYKFAGKPSVHGYWGALSYLDQADTPRWAALVAYQANPTAVVPAPLPLTVTASNPPATQGGKLPVVLTVKGGRGPYSAAVKSGALPAGRSLALLCERGTYTTTGAVPAYEIEVTDRLGSKASVTLNRTVLAQKAGGLRFWELEVISTSFSERGFVSGGKVNEVTFRNGDGSLDNLLAVVPYASVGFMYEHRAFDGQRNTVAEFPGLTESAKRLRFDLGEGEAGRPAQIGLNSEAAQEWAAPLKFRVRATNDEDAWKAGTAPVVIDQSTNAHGNQNNPLGYPTNGTPKFFAVTYP